MSTKRKSSQREESYGDGMADYDSDGPTSAPAPRKGSSKSGESMVTKRTLQNRKAQREFRKRREARVRDLEERCRRFDQMGLEANVELQRMARNLREENEALRGFIIRVGYGNMMPSILEGIGQNNNSSNEQSFQPAFGGVFGDSDTGKGTNEGQGMFQQFSDQHRRSASNKTPHSAPAQRSSFRDSKAGQSWNEHHQYLDKKNSSDEKGAGSPGSEATSESSQSAPLLSLNLTRNSDKAQRQPDFTTNANDQSNRSRMLPAATSSQTALNTLLGQMSSQMTDQPDGSGMAGSAMLSNYTGQSPRGAFPSSGQNSFAPYSVPQRIHQNDALLNPNPIPFAFNLSNEPPNSATNWWEQMGGGRYDASGETMELDEKAQAVAAAQANNGGAQSPFDLSAFLQGGITPGGGYNFGGFSSSQDDMLVKKEQDASTSSKSTLNDTDHMRTFVRLLEQKVAEREAKTVASLGFQPPSQDPSQRNGSRQEQVNDTAKVIFASTLSPSGVYSRLSEHPAFLTTDARELEELVDALGAGAARSPSEQQQQDRQGNMLGNGNTSSPFSMHQYAGEYNRSASHGSGSTSSIPRDTDGGSVAVDERVIDRLLGILDQKSMPRGMKSETVQQSQNVSLAMT